MRSGSWRNARASSPMVSVAAGAVAAAIRGMAGAGRAASSGTGNARAAMRRSDSGGVTASGRATKTPRPLTFAGASKDAAQTSQIRIFPPT
jgi:succinyl-CoA synthetase alpha subunit